jgi:hypothetical protein
MKQIILIAAAIVVSTILIILFINDDRGRRPIESPKPPKSIESLTIGIAYHDVIDMSKAEFYSKHYLDAQKEYHINWKTFAAVTRVESKFNPYAISSAGARGLMQLVPSTASEVAKIMGDTYKDGYEFRDTLNLKWGCYHLSRCRANFGDQKYIGAYLIGSARSCCDAKTYDSLVRVEFKKLALIEDGLIFIGGDGGRLDSGGR